MGLYIASQDVQVRLAGKVRFTDNADDVNKMHFSLLNRLIAEAEGQVEQDLSPRYFAPFQTDAGDPFNTLPERPTKNILRTLCEIQSVIRVLETDFGSGTAMNGDSYASKLRDRYADLLKRIMDKRDGKEAEPTGWKYPPMPGLRLNYFNSEADDGFMGMALNTTQGVGGFPRTQINDPRENFTNGTFDELDDGNPGV